MAILALDNEIELVVTWICNWHCEYCCVDTHNRPKLPFAAVKDKLERVPEKSFVTLSGGEVGSMKRPEIEHILSTLEHKQCKIGLNTNGLFLQRYSDLLPRFELVLYHCTEDLQPTDEVITGVGPNVQYLIIVTDNNYERLGTFLDKYPDIQFNLVAASNPVGITGPTLSNKLKHRMVAEYHHRMTEDSKKRIFTEKDFDRITYI